MGLARKVDVDCALPSPLGGKAQQAVKDLLESARVADDHLRHVGAGAEREVHSPAHRRGRDAGEARLDAGAQIERMKSELELTAVDDRRVEDLVHESRQLFRSGQYD